ncbi:MAG: hypothetical protein BZY88_10050 [SAR202 cluster bacterium Io17-Chloro-G9]|nr:MAG: hypothetical protein BZY88_10050 [SAR202 cluster bacterium Io17-Chloro-G9]
MRYVFGLAFLVATGALSWIQLGISVTGDDLVGSRILIMTILSTLSYVGSFMIYAGRNVANVATLVGSLSLLQTLGLGIAVAVVAIFQDLNSGMHPLEYSLLIIYCMAFGVHGSIGILSGDSTH